MKNKMSVAGLTQGHTATNKPQGLERTRPTNKEEEENTTLRFREKLFLSY